MIPYRNTVVVIEMQLPGRRLISGTVHSQGLAGRLGNHSGTDRERYQKAWLFESIHHISVFPALEEVTNSCTRSHRKKATESEWENSLAFSAHCIFRAYPKCQCRDPSYTCCCLPSGQIHTACIARTISTIRVFAYVALSSLRILLGKRGKKEKRSFPHW